MQKKTRSPCPRSRRVPGEVVPGGADVAPGPGVEALHPDRGNYGLNYIKFISLVYFLSMVQSHHRKTVIFILDKLIT